LISIHIRNTWGKTYLFQETAKFSTDYDSFQQMKKTKGPNCETQFSTLCVGSRNNTLGNTKKISRCSYTLAAKWMSILRMYK